MVDVSFLVCCWRLGVACWDFGKLEHDGVALGGKNLTDFVKSTERPVPGADFHLCCRLVAEIQLGSLTAHTVIVA